MLPFQGAEDTVKRPRTGEQGLGVQGDDGGVAKFEVRRAAEGVEVCRSDQGSLRVFFGGAAVESYICRPKAPEIDLVKDRLLVRVEDLGFAPGHSFFVEMEGACGGFDHF